MMNLLIHRSQITIVRMHVTRTCASHACERERSNFTRTRADNVAIRIYASAVRRTRSSRVQVRSAIAFIIYDARRAGTVRAHVLVFFPLLARCRDMSLVTRNAIYSVSPRTSRFREINSYLYRYRSIY